MTDALPPPVDVADVVGQELLRILGRGNGAEEPDADLVALGLDSLAMTSLMVAVENRLGVTLPDSALRKETFASPRSIIAAFSR